MKRLALAFAALLVLALPATAFAARDRDRDGIPDRWEKKHHLSLKRSSANGDRDRDHVDNWNEWREGTDPRKRDSNRDGRPDGREDRDRDHLSNAAEDATGNDPRDRDSDNDGVPDGREQAGKVSSFEDGVLVIQLASGGSATGLVADDTDISCESEAEAEHRRRKGAARASVEEGDDPSFEEEPDDGLGSDEPADEELGDGDLGDDDTGLDDGGDDGSGGKQSCSEAALKRGARVRKAKLKLTADGLVFSASTCCAKAAGQP